MLSQSESDSLFIIIQMSRTGRLSPVVSTEFDHNNWRGGNHRLQSSVAKYYP